MQEKLVIKKYIGTIHKAADVLYKEFCEDPDNKIEKLFAIVDLYFNALQNNQYEDDVEKDNLIFKIKDCFRVISEEVERNPDKNNPKLKAYLSSFMKMS